MLVGAFGGPDYACAYSGRVEACVGSVAFVGFAELGVDLFLC